MAAEDPVGRRLHALILSGPTRLAFVPRFSGCAMVHRENNAEHSWLVAIYAMVIGEWYNEQVETHPDLLFARALSVETAVYFAVIHDVEEAVSGDFPRPFKYSTPELRDALNKAGENAFEQVFEVVLGGLHGHARRRLRLAWQTAKDPETLEGCLVRFCDFLAVVACVAREGIQHNPMLREHVGDLPAYARTFDHPQYNFIRPWVRAAQDIVDGAWGI